MRNSTRSCTYLFVLVALVSVGVMSTRLDRTSLAQAPSDQRVEIVIRDYAFEVMRPAPVRPGLPTVLILRNQDIVRHGFTSQMLMGMLVHGEGEGVGTYGKGVEGFYIDPGKTLVIRFTNDRPGKYAFRCDLHPNMKGELYALEVPTA
jgi:plastocyanin